MALHVWLVEGSKIILNIEQILKVPVLAKIYNDWHNDRELMYKIFKFIDCYADEDGYIHRNGLKDQKAFDYAIEVAQLNSDFRPTKDMIEAINWLVEHNINYVGQMFFETVNALQAGKDLMAVMNKNLRNDLKKDSFTKEEIGGMLGYMREITKMGKDLPKLIAELKEAEDNYVKSKLKKTIVRGGKELAASMDVHNNIDNGAGGGIDMID